MSRVDYSSEAKNRAYDLIVTMDQMYGLHLGLKRRTLANNENEAFAPVSEWISEGEARAEDG